MAVPSAFEYMSVVHMRCTITVIIKLTYIPTMFMVGNCSKTIRGAYDIPIYISLNSSNKKLCQNIGLAALACILNPLRRIYVRPV